MSIEEMEKTANRAMDAETIERIAFEVVSLGPYEAAEALLIEPDVLIASVQLESSHKAAGRTLAELNIHSRTGATVIAVVRGESGLVVPGGSETLRDGDVLALVGTQDAVDSAEQILLETKDQS